MARERKFSTEDLFRETKKILLSQGFDRFTFSQLAERLQVSRGTIYKYYENKEELVTAYMIYEMNQFLHDLQEIETKQGFDEQFAFFMELIFSHYNIYHIMEIGQQIPMSTKRVKENKIQLDKLHLELYERMSHMIATGREEGKLRTDLPDGLILGYIFQSVAIPNHFDVPVDKWVWGIKELICHGIFLPNQ